MPRRIALALLFLIAIPALAQTRQRAVVPVHPDISGNTVTGIVSSVSGPFILLADGLVTIDTSDAKIAGDVILPGSLVFAVLKPGDVAPNAPLAAAYVAVTQFPQVSLTGPVTAVDLTNNTLTLLGRTIKVTPQTVISGFMMTFKAMTLADILPNQIVQVEANVSAGALVARSIYVAAMSPLPFPTLIHGNVKSIGHDAWVITVNGKDVTVTVNTQTKIAGDPKVGDSVDVLVTSDNVALTILKVTVTVPTPNPLHLTGFVASIGATQWTIGLGPPGSLAPDFLLQVNANTKIAGNPKVGDRVEIVAELTHGGLLATSITKIP